MEKIIILELSVMGENEAIFKQIAGFLEDLKKLHHFEVLRITDSEGDLIIEFKK